MVEALTPEDVVRLAAHAQLRFDETRQSWLLLGPERIFSPSPTAVAVIQACDGIASIRALALKLAQEYAAPEDVILADALKVLQGLADKGYLARSSAS